MNEQMLNELKALHAPSRRSMDFYRPVCVGCDADGWDAEAPEWPCQTADILWPTEEERAAVLADWHAWADPEREACAAKRPPSLFGAGVETLYQERIKAQLDAARFFDQLRGGDTVKDAVVRFERQ